MGKHTPAARRVSNLTSSQIEKKRAIDRMNQRHCQQKKRERMVWLETEVARLTQRLDDAEAELQQHRDAGCLWTSSRGSESAVHDAAILSEAQTRTSKIKEPKNPAATTTERSVSWTLDLKDLIELRQDEGVASLTGLENIVFEYPLPPPAAPALHTPGHVPEWQLFPLHLPPTTDLEDVIIEIIKTDRPRKLECRATELSQPQFPSISSLLNPYLEDDEKHPLTSALAAYIVRQSMMQTVTPRIGIMYILSHLLRWLIRRDKQSYDELPDFVKPTYLQRTVPHPSWVDVCIWPEVRDYLIRGKEWTNISFDHFRAVTAASMSVNWPYTDSGAFLDSGDGHSVVLNPIFENHIRDIRSWSMGPEVARVFPFLEPFCTSPAIEIPISEVGSWDA